MKSTLGIIKSKSVDVSKAFFDNNKDIKNDTLFLPRFFTNFSIFSNQATSMPIIESERIDLDVVLLPAQRRRKR